VKDVNFQINENEVLGLVGESGSGKTTIGRALVGLTPISGGEIEILGLKMKSGNKGKNYRSIREKIGFVFQDPATSFNPLMTIGQAVAEPLLTYKRYSSYEQTIQAVEELLDQVELPRGYVNRFPHELSGGQRQRVGFARALALNPKLLIADEPTSALDVTVQAKVLDLFRSLQHEHKFSCLFITHDLAVVNEISDSIIVLHNGEIVERGLTEQVIHHPQELYTQKLLASVPIPDPRGQAEHRAQLAALNR
jgi:peptide/nickel transport system ATP-binding protein